MSEVILFNHIPKTAGSTMRRVLFRTVGSDRVLFSTTLGMHREAIAEIAEKLDRPLDGRYAIAAHTGYGVEKRLPARHSYSLYTVLRDPVQRTISAYYHMHDHDDSRTEMSFERFLRESHLHSFNSQTAFLGGLTARHHLEGAPLEPARMDRDLLEEAKRNLASHDVVGLTERFDETLLLLRDAYGWPAVKTVYQRTNVGTARRRASLSTAELEAIAANNELDMELYEYGRELFEARLAERVPDHGARLQRFQRLNTAYGRVYPIVYKPTRALLRGARRLRSRSPVPV